ncbi:MAG: Asp-tRNA(Asn)/Glu-tRNA(Gln) amidotransferase subunit GatA [Firmicutes bacterium]|nr:Asp-tRNA(Asn)/Glu-tRNA(Gln) amidotransferase subunit GatA [Bacillota bacterium]MDH7494564.1 Asp-tRNA(Asn)/Glu-tRNA(Gln) amidotransferase subunit GatA [Bacillota bacterium]
MRACELTAHELRDVVRRREASVEEVVRSSLDRIAEVDESVCAYVTVARERALAKARLADERLARGEPARPLEGIPIALKDNMCTKGIETTCSSKILRGFVPPYDATVVGLLESAGAVIIGKTNMDEFAMGSSTENSGFFPTRNPWDLGRVPGGSSGGSAAAVAADEAVAALGSDTGGSVRQPASFCGVVGLKPTYGLVSRYGLIAFASSLDQIGPLTKDVRDCALVLSVIAGHDPRDSTSVPREPCDYLKALVPDVRGLRIGVPREYFGDGMSPAVRAAVGAALKTFQDMGAILADVSLPHSEYALATYYIVAPAEASSNLARYDGVRYGYRSRESSDCVSMMVRTRSEGFGAEVKRRIMLGTYTLSAGYYEAYYLKALKVRTLITRDFDRAFEECDCLVSPTSPTVAFRFGERTEDPLAMYLSDVYTVTANLVGIPAVSIPCGFGEDGMPVGLQILGKHYGEGTVLRVAYAFEQAAGFHKPKPTFRESRGGCACADEAGARGGSHGEAGSGGSREGRPRRSSGREEDAQGA